jgi:hypothetical protein
MKHLRKFEELDYSTYMRAADKMFNYGQTKKSEEVKVHAKNMAMTIIKNMDFDILVGSVKQFPGAKFLNARIFKSGTAWTLQVMFESTGDYTHNVMSRVTEGGEISWQEGNKFMNRKSVIKFGQLIEQLCQFQPDFVGFLKEYNLNSGDLKLIQRTYYF